MSRICYSSEIYNLATEDIMSLPDSPLNFKSPAETVTVLLGNRQKWNDKTCITPDTLLSGRKLVERALAAREQYIPVQIAFTSEMSAYNFWAPIIRVLRYKYKKYSSRSYHMRPSEIRERKLERGMRTAENAYIFSNPKYKMAKAERRKMYDKLVSSMRQNGYDENYPLDIMLCRNMGVKDTLNQGHHRLGVAIECGIERVPVIFSAAGQAPKFMQPLCRLIAEMNMWFKHLANRAKKS